MKIIFTTGGTAGHIFPAIATIQALCKKYPDAEVLFVGAKAGLEQKLITEATIPFKALPVQGIMRKGFFRTISSLFFMLYSLLLALKICLQYKPNVIVGFGGYASFPCIFVARFLCIPIVIHEQNSVPGTVTKFMAKFANTICITFENVAHFFPNKHVVVTGNPTRSSLVLPEGKLETTSSKNILIVGGSLGAMRLNALVVALAPLLLKKGFFIWHQTGAKHFNEVMTYYKAKKLESKIQVTPFIEDMQEAYIWADFAICRAGASTITELAIMAVPAIFIPFPFAVHNHQYYNAKELVDKKASLCLEEKNITDTALLHAIEHLTTPPALYEMKQKLHKYARPLAAEHVVKEIERYIQH